MSSRSRASGKSRSSGATLELEDIYQYALRAAYLSYLSAASAVPDPSPTTPGGGGKAPTARAQAKPQSEGWTSALFSVGDVFREPKDSRSVQFPEKLVRVLGKRIEAIVRGTDPAYSDHLFRRTFGVFYGVYNQESFLKQMKTNRKIEELILLFVTTATGVLRKQPEGEGDEWKPLLNTQVGQFVKLIRDCLQDIPRVPPELNARLETYSAKIAPPPPSSSPEPPTPSTSSAADANPWTISHSVQDMPLVRSVGQLFGIQEGQLQKDVNAVRRSCTEKASLGIFRS